MAKEVKLKNDLIHELIVNEEFFNCAPIDCFECSSMEDEQYTCTNCWEYKISTHGIDTAWIIEQLYKHESGDKEFDNIEHFRRIYNESNFKDNYVYITVFGEHYKHILSNDDIDDFDPEYDSLDDVFYINVNLLIQKLIHQ